MNTRIDEINDGIYRLSTHVTDIDFTFNQFLIDADEPLLFHSGPRRLFDAVSSAVTTITPLDRLQWISFGHVEADECGSMNQWLAAVPDATVVHGSIGVMVSLNDLADRPPRPLADGEVLHLGGRSVRWVDTPHVPHGWEAGLLFEEETRTLLCGDLFTQLGNPRPLTESDLVGAAADAEDMFHATCLTPATGPTIRALADLEPATLAVMHGASFMGNGRQALLDLEEMYSTRLRAAMSDGPMIP